jgi:tRNA pseudouridine65 synthase
MSQKSAIQAEIKADIKFEILLDEADFIAINKPSGILVHRNEEARGDKVFVLQALKAQTGYYLYPIHRLDRATSGVLVFGKSPEGARLLQEAMTSPEARKVYLTLVRGTPDESGLIDIPLSDLHAKEKIFREAHTEYRRLQVFESFVCSLMEVEIKTGRQHQIRRHFDRIAHQVIGDSTYGKGRINRLFREQYKLHRLFLHCRLLAMDFKQKRYELQAPLAPELAECLKLLSSPVNL